MDIEANCGCGAKLKLSPASGYSSLGSYSSDTQTREERAAVAEAFKEWVSAHQGCTRHHDPLPIGL